MGLQRECIYVTDEKGGFIVNPLCMDKFVFVGKGLGTHRLQNSLVPSYYIDENGNQKKKNQTSMITMRPIINEKIKKLPWYKVDKFPAHLVDRAIDECSKNYTSVINKRIETGQFHQFRYKSKRKCNVETFEMEVGMFSKRKNTIFATKIGTVRTSENFMKPTRQAKLQYNKNTKDWYLIFVVDVVEKEICNRYDIVSIDPGEKLFASLYCPDGHVTKICEDNRQSRMFRELARLDSLMSKRRKIDKTTYKRAIHRIYKKIKNLKTDLHNKLSTYICKNYNNIVIPKYGTQKMMSNLNSKVCRSMSTLSFYEFKQKLNYKSKIYNCKIFDVEEHLTTKTCGNCGKYNIPRDRDYTCINCKIEIHRDFNASRNILLKNLKHF